MIDLSRIEPPAILEELDFEQLLQDKIERFKSVYPDWNAALESDPVMKLLELSAYDELQHRARINHASRARLLAFAEHTDLEHTAAIMGVERAVLVEADPDANPPIEAVMESDGRLRLRTQLAPEGFSCAGPREAYRFHALTASAEVADVHVSRPIPGTVQLHVMKDSEDGLADGALLDVVSAYVNGEKIRPLNDTILVSPATAKTFDLSATFEFYEGPDQDVAIANRRYELEQMLLEQRKIGNTIALSAIYDALHGPGIKRVTLTSPTTDIECAESEYPRCESITLTKV